MPGSDGFEVMAACRLAPLPVVAETRLVVLVALIEPRAPPELRSAFE